MPLYEYKCLDCNRRFEELIGNTVPEKTPLCPECGSENCQKLFSTFAAAIGGKSSEPSCYNGGCSSGGFT